MLLCSIFGFLLYAISFSKEAEQSFGKPTNTRKLKGHSRSCELLTRGENSLSGIHSAHWILIITNTLKALVLNVPGPNGSFSSSHMANAGASKSSGGKRAVLGNKTLAWTL